MGDVLQFLPAFLLGLAAGGMLSDLLVLHPEQRGFGADTNLALHDESLKRIDRYRPPMIGLSTLCGLLLLIFEDLSTTATVGVIVAVVACGLLAVSGIPASRVRASDAAPEEIVERLDSLHVARTAVAIIALAGFLVAAVAG